MNHLISALRALLLARGRRRAPIRTSLRPLVELLESRWLPSGFTDYTALAQQFAPHQGLTMLYVNFDGGNISYNGNTQHISPLKLASQDVQSVLSQLAQIYAPFNVQVQQMTGFGNYDQGTNANSTIFVGAIDTDFSNGQKVAHAFTPLDFVDSGEVINGVNHQPDTDPYHLAFVDPVGASSTQSDTVIADGIAHEAGHTFGLVHVLTGPGAPQDTWGANNPADVMSYDAPNKQFLDRAFPITDWNFTGSQLVHGGEGFFPHWLNGDGSTSKILTQDSYTYLMAVLGPANAKPGTPQPSAPLGSVTTTTPTYSWNTVSGAASYNVWVNDVTTGVSKIVFENVATASDTPTTALKLGDSYRWWVQAVNGNGTAGDWSGGLDFTVVLGKPNPIAPMGTTNTTQPIFSWSAVSGAAHYELWVDDVTANKPQVIFQTGVPQASFQSTGLNVGDAYRWWVQAVNSNGVKSGWSVEADFTVALATPTLIGPTGSAGTTLPTFSWNPVAGATQYTLWVNDVTTGTGKVIFLTNLTSPSFPSTTALHAGDAYRWWVQASAPGGYQSAWSNAADFSVTLATPTLIGPTGTVGNTQPTFAWNAVTGATNYTLVIRDVTAGTQVFNQSVTGTSYSSTPPLKTGDSFSWTVQATNANLQSAVSSALNFSVILGPPTPLSPAGTASTTFPTFTWNTVAGANQYYIWVDDITTGARGVISQYVAAGAVPFTPTSPLTSNDTYRWWLLSVAADGGFSAWSSSKDFTISLPVPTSLAPGGTVASLQPTFSWSAVAGATAYGIWVDDLTTGQGGIVNTQTSAPNFTPSSNLRAGHHYQWWVYAANTTVFSDWSAGQDFTVALATPTPTSPSGMVYNNFPTFSWNGVSGADYYDVQVDDVTTGQSGLIKGPVFATAFQPTQPLAGGHAYRWWVIAATNSNVFSNWSAAQNFTIALGTANPIGPAGYVADTQPTFSWTPVNGAVSYNLWVDDRTLGQRGVINVSVSGNSYSPGTFAINHTYYWWVQAVAADHTSGSWSNYQSFTVALGTPTLVGPLYWSWDWQPTFGWNAVSGAARYEIYVQDLSTGTTVIDQIVLGSTSYQPSFLLGLGESYTWWVRAFAADGSVGNWSNGFSFATPGLSAPPDATC